MQTHTTLKKKYDKEIPRKETVFFIDTDSFYYSICTVDDLDGALGEGNMMFDFSKYPIEHSNCGVENKMVPGKFKDECPTIIFVEFDGLRAKMYSIIKKMWI